MVLLTCVLGALLFFMLAFFDFLGGEWISGLLFLLGGIGFSAGARVLVRGQGSVQSGETERRPGLFVASLPWIVPCALILGAALVISTFGGRERTIDIARLTNQAPDFTALWSTGIMGGVLMAGAIAFYAWAFVSTKRAHPGKTIREAISEQRGRDDEAAAKRAGFVMIVPEEHTCSPPMFTGPRARFTVGIGSIWECADCHTRWRLLEHEVPVGFRGRNGSSWGPAPDRK